MSRAERTEPRARRSRSRKARNLLVRQRPSRRPAGEGSAARAAKRWYETFFGSDYLKQYVHTTTPREVDGLERLLHVRKGARILDVACGAGRHAIELAKRGHHVVGFDLSEDLLKEGRAAARAARAKVTFVQGDMRRIPYKAEFDAAINMFTSFGYFETAAEDGKALAAIARALRPRGKFVMERFNRETLPGELPTQGWRVNDDGTVVLQEDSFDLLGGRYETRQIVIDRRGVREHLGSVRAYTLPELMGLFESAGLPVHRVLGGLDLTPFTSRSRRTVLYAVKGVEPEGIRTVW